MTYPNYGEPPPPGGPPLPGPQEPARPQVGSPAATPWPTTPPQAARAGLDARGRVHRTRVSGVWIGVVLAGIILILLIIFIAQNLNDAPIHFLGLHGQVSIGLALLLAGVCGLLIAAVPASIRIWQLRTALRKNARRDVPPSSG
jgi:uncharacterized integral membrane protein